MGLILGRSTCHAGLKPGIMVSAQRLRHPSRSAIVSNHPAHTVLCQPVGIYLPIFGQVSCQDCTTTFGDDDCVVPRGIAVLPSDFADSAAVDAMVGRAVGVFWLIPNGDAK